MEEEPAQTFPEDMWWPAGVWEGARHQEASGTCRLKQAPDLGSPIHAGPARPAPWVLGVLLSLCGFLACLGTLALPQHPGECWEPPRACSLHSWGLRSSGPHSPLWGSAVVSVPLPRLVAELPFPKRTVPRGLPPCGLQNGLGSFPEQWVCGLT